MVVAAFAKAAFILFVVIGVLAPVITWIERKQSALMQDRIGANRASVAGTTLIGLMHPAADVIKLLVKEDVVPAGANRLLHLLAPVLAVIPAMIAVVCLRKLGPHHGMRLFLTGDRFDGKQAVEYGLAHRAVSPDQLMAAVQEEIDLINLGGPNALAECKKLVRAIPGGTIREDFELTKEWSLRMFQTEEAAEGMGAFREKRKPRWVAEQTAEGKS